MSFLTLPPRLVLRALEDLHALASAARRLPEIQRYLERRLDRLDDHLSRGLAAAHRLEENTPPVADVLDLVKRLTAAAAKAGDRAESLERVATRLEPAASSLDATGAEIVAVGPDLTETSKLLDAKAGELVTGVGDLTAAERGLERTAGTLVEGAASLEQAVGRLVESADGLGRAVATLERLARKVPGV